MKIPTVLTPVAALSCALLVLAGLVLQLHHLEGAFGPTRPAVADARRVTLLTAFSIQDSARYQEAFAQFEKDTGIEVTLRAAGGDFADHVYVATPGFDAPDIGLFAQPGLFRDMMAAGFVQPLPPDLSAQVQRDFPAFLDPLLGHEGRRHGVWARVAIKSLVWYRRALFERYGFAVPTTDRQLAALERAMIRRGFTPWCVGVAARGATGWVATDWVEEFMLRQAGAGDYDRWVAGDLPFSAPPVRTAFAAWDRMVHTPGMVDGGVAGVLGTQVEEAARRFASDPAPCLMMRNSEWVVSEFPEGMPVGPADAIDFFVLPGRSAAHTELLVAGDIAAALNTRPETMAVLRHMASADFARRRAAAGAYLSAHAQVTPNSYADPLSGRLAEVWRRASVMRMDASDLMPPAVGTAAFWTAMIDHLQGSPVPDATAGIDRAWRRWRAAQEIGSPPAGSAPAAAAPQGRQP
ncbi:extracellular solute-binding protein [Aquincola sp. MAHUQ-54]|uniref:Extracellular solute-binding protein n=1 Tax=Aquincola agrisoli TaxID=3119538 RepID=A0AAW9QP48_9BURK